MKKLASGIMLLAALATSALSAGATTPAATPQDIEVLLQKGQGLYQQAQYDEAIAVFEDIDKQFGAAKDAATRERVATALGFKGAALQDKRYRGKALEVWEEADRRYARDSDPAMRATLSRLLYNRLYTLVGLSIRGPHKDQQAEFESAMVVFDEFERRYGQDQDPAIREMAVLAFFQKAVALGHRPREKDIDTYEFSAYRNKESVAVLDELVRRYGADSDPAVREVAARALFAKASTFSQIGRHQDKDAAYAELDRRYGQDETPAVRVLVIQGLAGKAWGLVQDSNMSGQKTKDNYIPAIAAMDEIIRRFGQDRNAEVQQQVIEVYFNKVKALRSVQDAPVKEIVALYDEIIRLYGQDATPAIRAQVARALCGKGVFLADSRPKEALAVLDEVDKRYAGDTTSAVRVQVANALLGKGKLFLGQKQHHQANAAFEQVIKRYKGEKGLSREVSLADFYRYGER